MVIGWLRPVILLPATALTGLSSDQLSLILGHELAHLRRHDYLINLVQSVIETSSFTIPPSGGSPRGFARSERTLRRLGRGALRRPPGVCPCPGRPRGNAIGEPGPWPVGPGRFARWPDPTAPGGRPVEQPPARGMAGMLALTTLALLGPVLFIAPGTNSARAAAEDRRFVTGLVLSADGKPVAGADVWLVAQDYPQPTAVEIDRSRSDQTGHFA